MPVAHPPEDARSDFGEAPAANRRPRAESTFPHSNHCFVVSFPAGNTEARPYTGDRDHPAVVYDYTPTRERAGPEEFLKSYRGYLQADAYAAYDSFFAKPERGMTEVACWPHTRRHFHKALDADPSHMRTVLPCC